MTLSVVTAAPGFTTAMELAGAIAFHAAFAVTGVQLVGLSKRIGARQADAAAM